MQVLTQLYLTGQSQLSWSQTTREETPERMESEDHPMWLSSNSAPPQHQNKRIAHDTIQINPLPMHDSCIEFIS